MFSIRSAHLIVLLSAVFYLCGPEPVIAQKVLFHALGDTVQIPKSALKTRFRIRIYKSDPAHTAEARKLAEEFVLKYHQNIYFEKQNEQIQLLAGDFREKKYASARMKSYKKHFKKVKTVKSDNALVIEYAEFIPAKPRVSPPPRPAEKPKEEDVKKAEPLKVKSGLPGWDDPVYLTANTAAKETYLTAVEKEVYRYLNLARMNPQLFAETYYAGFKYSENGYERSLYEDLMKQAPLPILKPDRKLYESAHCHAVESGKTGYIGHDRKKCKASFMGECCHYGSSTAKDVVDNLLIDNGVESLGHRLICLGTYEYLGVSIQPHRTYGQNAVLDFR